MGKIYMLASVSGQHAHLENPRFVVLNPIEMDGFFSSPESSEHKPSTREFKSWILNLIFKAD